MKIPVFHDDQHGTAIISGAALLNALEIVGKDIDDIRVVFSGAGAAAISTAEHYVRLGVQRENIIHVRPRRRDLQGSARRGRSVQGALRARDEGADARRRARRRRRVRRTLGRRRGDRRDGRKRWRRSRSSSRSPTRCPRSCPKRCARCATTRSSPPAAATIPNQVNNVLGFPFIFRGALDVRATEINEEMKMAATRALALLAKEDVPEQRRRALRPARRAVRRRTI